MSTIDEQINVRYWMDGEAEEMDYFKRFAEEELHEIRTIKIEAVRSEHASIAQEFAEALQERMHFASSSGLQYDKQGRPYVTIRRDPRGHALEDALAIMEAAGI